MRCSRGLESRLRGQLRRATAGAQGAVAVDRATAELAELYRHAAAWPGARAAVDHLEDNSGALSVK